MKEITVDIENLFSRICVAEARIIENRKASFEALVAIRGIKSDVAAFIANKTEAECEEDEEDECDKYVDGLRGCLPDSPQTQKPLDCLTPREFDLRYGDFRTHDKSLAFNTAASLNNRVVIGHRVLPVHVGCGLWMLVLVPPMERRQIPKCQVPEKDPN